MSRTCPYQDCKCPNLSNASRACPACGRPVYWMGRYDYTELITDRTREFTGRDWVFAKLEAWLTDPSGQRVFFLGGGPGSGKSAVAARLVQLARGDVLTDKWPLLAQTGLTYYHFCQARYDALIEPVGFVKSLALALADRYPIFAQALTQIGERHPKIHIQQSVGQATDSAITAVKIDTLEVGGLSARKAFAHLVSEPLEVLAQSGETATILILVDALDEALTFDQDDNLVTLLAAVTDDPRDLPQQVRFIVTSRPDPRVTDLIGKPVLDLIDDAPADQHDVQAYAARRLTPVLADATERNELASRIAEQGLGNFLYARYVLDDFLKDPTAPALLTLPAGLDEVYACFLKRELGQQGRTWRTYRPLLGALVIARGAGLTRQQLAGLMAVRASAVEELLEPCMQYLNGVFPDGPFRIYHQSFRDFLLASNEYRLEVDEVREDVARYFWAQYTAFRDKGLLLDDYTLANLPVHLAESGSHEELRSLRFDYNWLQTKLDRLGVNALLADFTLVERAADDTIWRLRRALEQGAYVLRLYPDQLASQVHGKLCDDTSVEIRALLNDAVQLQTQPWLRPMTPSLREPSALACTLEGHTGEVNGVAISPDGKVIISASGDHTLKVWKVENGRELRTLTGHTDEVLGVTISGNGRLAVSASKDRMLKIWDVESGIELHTLEGHEDEVLSVAISEDGRLAVSASKDRTLKVWDVESGTELHTLEGHEDEVLSVAVSEDGRLAVSASKDRTLKVWHVESGTELRTLKGHRNEVLGVAISGDGRLAISASWDKTLKVWDVESGRELYTLAEHAGGVLGVSISEDGKVAVSVSLLSLTVWDLTSGKGFSMIPGHVDSVNGVTMSRDGMLAISASSDRTLRMWYVKHVESGWKFGTPESHKSLIEGVAMSGDGRLAVSASWDKTLKVWDVESGGELRTFKGHTDSVYGVAMSEDGKVAISASGDGTLKVWDIDSGRELRTLTEHRKSVQSVAMSGDGRLAVSASWDKTLKVWDVESGRELRTFKDYTESVYSVVMSSDGKVAISASADGTLKVWDVDSGRELRTFNGHMESIHGVAMSKDGRLAISASRDKTLKVWDVESGRELRALIGHAESVNCVAMSSDGKVAVSASSDKTLKVWNVESGLCLTTFHADCQLYACAVNSEGRNVLGGSGFGQMHFLHLEE
jgi:WD40 repeat protein